MKQTDAEIYDEFRSTLKSAINHCGLLATLPAKGPTYRKMIAELQTIEQNARLFGLARSDARWVAFSLEMEAFHRRIGDAIRAAHARKIFLSMQQMMKAALVYADKMKDAKTGILGPVTPKVQPGPLRENRSVYVRPSGLLAPSSVH